MATNHTIGITIDAEVNGTADIENLARELDDFAKVAEGDAAQAAKELAARLRGLGEQDAAISGFLALEREVGNSATALAAAEREASSYAQQISKLGPPTVQEAANLQRLEQAAEATRVEFTQQQQALAGAQSVLQRYGVAGDAAKEAQQRLRNEIAGVSESAREIAPAYQRAASGVQSASGAMVQSTQRVGEGVDSIGKRLSALQGLLAGFVGVAGIKAVATDFAEVADQVNNLQSRIKLVTGEGDAFAQAWAGVGDVAQRTGAELEATGALFTRLVQAGTDAGLSAQAASASALGLTETINQAIQLSGASAQASNAAITQLVQGLQGGVLRGDEFNSVMEQSPRLARALADGLGVTTGELRKMAEAGRLSSETVIDALRGQKDVLEAEFKSLPPTVGRALENLNTQWRLYVAEADKATGASAAAADAIDALAGNLQTLAGLLLDAGQAGAAFVALRLAQSFVGIGAAAQQAAVSVAAHNAQLAATSSAVAGAAAGAGRLAAIFATLRTFTLVGIVANAKDIGTWMGEAAAKLAGYRDQTEKLADAERMAALVAENAAESRARMAAAVKEQIEKQFELSNAAKQAVAEFEKLTKEGTNAGEALKRASDSFDLSKMQGVRDFSAVLDKLAADGKVSAAEFEAAWSKALSGTDLAQFEVIAKAAFGGTAREAERVAQVMDAVLREAVKRTGVDFESLQGKIGAAARGALNDVDVLIDGIDRLKNQGVDAGRALTASLSKAIDTADGEQALELLRQKIEQVRKVLGDKVADGLLDDAKKKSEALRDAMDKATPGINSVAEAMKALGVTSDASLKATAATAKQAYDTLSQSGKASARELGEAFEAAARKAIEANNGLAPFWVQAEAAARGYRVVVDQAGKSTLELASATDKAAGAHHRAADGADTHKTALERLNAARERDIASQEKALELEERAAELERKQRGVDKEGFSVGADGQRITMSVPNERYVFDTATSQGLSEQQALELVERFIRNGQPTGTRDSGMDWFSTVNQAVSDAVLQNARNRVGGQTTLPNTGGMSPGAGTASDSMRVVNLYVGGSTTPRTIPTTAQGESNLRALSKDFVNMLEQARGTAA